MKLGDYLTKDFVLPDLKATAKADVLQELVAPIREHFPEADAEAALSVLTERENLGTTGIGDEIAIPHGKMSDLDRIVVIVGRSFQGVDFDALDFKPCKIFFVVLAPEQVTGLHLRILAHISRLLKDETFRKAFMESDGGDGLWKLLMGA